MPRPPFYTFILVTNKPDGLKAAQEIPANVPKLQYTKVHCSKKFKSLGGPNQKVVK